MEVYMACVYNRCSVRLWNLSLYEYQATGLYNRSYKGLLSYLVNVVYGTKADTLVSDNDHKVRGVYMVWMFIEKNQLNNGVITNMIFDNHIW